MLYLGVPIYQMNKYLLVLEYSDGGTLNTYLNEHFKDLDWNDKYRLAFQIASAIECIHERGIIHRDLVSNNDYLLFTLIYYHVQLCNYMEYFLFI